MVEGGIFAIGGILAAAIVTLIQLTRAGLQRGLGYAALLIPITLHTQVELPFYISNTHWLTLLFILFLTHQFGKKEIAINKLSTSAKKSIPVAFIALFVTSSWLLIQTQTANAGLISYLNGKQSKPVYIVEGLKSPYFREYSEYLYYRKNMYAALKRKEKRITSNATDEFINWATESLKTSPATAVYKDLAIAYHIKRNFKKRDLVLQEAISMYNRDITLQKLRDKLQEESRKLKAYRRAKANAALPPNQQRANPQ